MSSRDGEWLRIWMVLTIIWTIVVAAFGWIDLPRAQHIPHNSELLNGLSHAAASILNGSESKAEPSREGALIWSDVPISVPMPNGTRLILPSTTTQEGIALVKHEYYKLLEAEAGAQTGPYILRMILAWFLPCLILLMLGLAADLAVNSYEHKENVPCRDYS